MRIDVGDRHSLKSREENKFDECNAQIDNRRNFLLVRNDELILFYFVVLIDINLPVTFVVQLITMLISNEEKQRQERGKIVSRIISNRSMNFALQ